MTAATRVPSSDALDFEEVAQFAFVVPRHPRTSARYDDQQAIALEDAHRLAYRRTADIEHRADLFLEQALVWPDSIERDHAGKARGNLLGERKGWRIAQAPPEQHALDIAHEVVNRVEQSAQVRKIRRSWLRHAMIIVDNNPGWQGSAHRPGAKAVAKAGAKAGARARCKAVSGVTADALCLHLMNPDDLMAAAAHMCGPKQVPARMHPCFRRARLPAAPAIAPGVDRHQDRV